MKKLIFNLKRIRPDFSDRGVREVAVVIVILLLSVCLSIPQLISDIRESSRLREETEERAEDISTSEEHAGDFSAPEEQEMDDSGKEKR